MYKDYIDEHDHYSNVSHCNNNNNNYSDKHVCNSL